MSSIRRFTLVSAAAALTLALPVFAQSSDANPAACIDNFDAATNYFPDELTVEYAQGFTLEYHDSYKLVTVTQPWQGAETPLIYALVQCGAPVPEDLPEDAQVIEVPVTSVVNMSTTYLPSLVELGLVDTLVALDEADYAYDETVRARIDVGDIIEVGSGPTVDVESLLDLNPGLILTFSSGFADYDTYPVVEQAGLPVAINSDYLETTPLGRAEWVKFIAAFFNREAEAETLFSQIEADYTDLVELAAGADERPTVLMNAMYSGTWYVSGGGSYAAELIADAGGDYLWADDDATGSLPLSFEAVLDIAQDANVWLNANLWASLADGVAEDARYSEFAAFEDGQVYNPILRMSELGGNDFYESSTLHPEYILGDLIAILHPDLLPDHEFFYYQQLQ